MKNFFKSLILAVPFAIAACGGGGGNDGTPSGPDATLRFFPPVASVALAVGGYGSIAEVRGGRGPLVVTSSDPSIHASLSSDRQVLVEALVPGTSTVAVTDQNDQVIKTTVTAVAAPLITSVGQSVAMKAGTTRTVSVGGGVAPYTISSNNDTIATATITGGRVTIVANANGSTNLTITDSVGTQFTIAVTVTSDVLVVAPTTGTGVAGTSLVFNVSGGKAPYSVSVVNPALASATVSGSSVSVSLIAAGATSLTITDSLGAAVAVTVTITPPAQSLAVSPATQSIAETSKADVNYTITGGKSPYFAVAANNPANTVVKLVGSTLTLSVPSTGTGATAVQGDRCVSANEAVVVNIYDQENHTVQATLNIIDNPAVACP